MCTSSTVAASITDHILHVSGVRNTCICRSWQEQGSGSTRVAERRYKVPETGYESWIYIEVKFHKCGFCLICMEVNEDLVGGKRGQDAIFDYSDCQEWSHRQ